MQEPKIGSVVRLAGVVKDGSIVKDSDGGKMEFVLSGQKNSVEVRYEAVAAKNFKAGREVVVEGVMGADGKFKARQIITRCESKYKTKLKDSL